MAATQTRDSPRPGGRCLSANADYPLQVAELEPLETQPLAGRTSGEPADTLADADVPVADVLDVHQSRDTVRVARSGDLDGLDRQAASGRSDGDGCALSGCALALLPADGCDVSVEADHLALQLGDLDCLDAQALASGSRCRGPAHVLHVGGDLEVSQGVRVVRLCW